MLGKTLLSRHAPSDKRLSEGACQKARARRRLTEGACHATATGPA